MSGPLAVLTPGFQTDLLMDIPKDIPGFLMSWCCPMVVLALTRTQVDGRDCGWFDCCCGASPYAVRQQIRKTKGLSKEPLCDVAALCICGPCAIFQMAKEIDGKFMPTPEQLKRM
eukprot:m.285095 g.285095  ORF g.285095 m.285095 type:complete len:115 (-) comp11294_c0_seq1:146-490(-)